jgi:hypothetical protein
MIESHVIFQQYNEAPFDFLLADHAADYPFTYAPEDAAVLLPYMRGALPTAKQAVLVSWVDALWRAGQPIQTFACCNASMRTSISLSPIDCAKRPACRLRPRLSRSAPAPAAVGLSSSWKQRAASGSRPLRQRLPEHPALVPQLRGHPRLGRSLLARCGLEGLRATTGLLVGTDHIAVALARLPEPVPPIEGSFGPPGSTLDVRVWMTPQP